MGKKQKGGRRQILQLEDKKQPCSSPKHQMKNLIHYSDSDDDSKKSNDSELSLTTGSKEVCSLDSQVADFFKEIDALTVDESASESVVPIDNLSSKEIVSDPDTHCVVKSLEGTNDSEQETKHKAYCPWQEICDDSTGYSYYWNVETNEVTWDCPEEYAAFMNSDGADVPASQSEDVMESLKKLQKKKESQLLEGAIIPISYFGGSSSSDESSNSDNVHTKSQKKRKKKEKLSSTNKNKSNKAGSTKSEIDNLSSEQIGPQLPPDFNFPQNIPKTVEQIDANDKGILNSEIDEFVETGTVLSQTSVCMPNLTHSEPKKASDLHFNISDIITTSVSNSNAVLVGSSTCEENENEFVVNKKNLIDIHKETGEERGSPNSTVNQCDILKNNALGKKLVVEYDSFTDEEEEELYSSNLPSIKQDITSNEPEPLPEIQIHVKEKSIEHEKTEFSEEIDKLNTAVNVKRKNINYSSEEPFESYLDRELKKVKPCSVVDIDSIFATHLSNQKHGFGFITQQSELTESNTSYYNYNQGYRSKSRKNEYKSVSFIKSENVLDLNQLSCDITTKDHGQALSKEDIPMDSLSLESSPVKETDTKVFHKTHLIEPIKVCEDKNIESTILKNLNINENEIKDKKIVASCRRETVELDFEEDIDEIDKALCEALEAKKAIESASVSASVKVNSASILEKLDTSTIEEKELNKGSIKFVKEELKKDVSEENKAIQDTDMVNILGLSSILMDKLTFLVSNHATLASLNTLLLQIQTRLVDWQAAALESKYFTARLQEVNQYIYQYEMGIVSGDWICQWDRENKRYYYMNTRTQHSQWSYPDELLNDKTAWIQSQSEIPTTSASSFRSERDESQPVSSSSSEGPLPIKDSKSCNSDENSFPMSPSNWSFQSSPPPPPPGVDSPPPPPPCSPPPTSPPPPPPDSTEAACALPEDMDLENSNDSCSQPIISNSNIYEINEIQYPSMIVCSSDSLINNFGDASVTNIVTTTLQTCENSSVISKSLHNFSNSHSGSNATTQVLWSAPKSSCSFEVMEGDFETLSSTVIPANSHISDCVSDPCQNSSSVTQPSSKDGVTNKTNITLGTTIRKERKKTKLLSVLALKKKNIPSLVEKWQKIKEEQEKEDN